MAGGRTQNGWDADLGQPIKIGIIGCGYWGPNHIRNFQALKNCDVVAAADLTEVRLHHVAEHYPDLKLTSDADEILSDDSIDAVVISTPTHTHAALVERSLSAGKHVLCEKPLCLESSEGEALVALAGRKNRALMVGHVFLFNPGLCELKALIDGGELGDIRYIASRRTNMGPVRADMNVSFDLASHDISILNWIFDALPASVSATGSAFVRQGVEDVVFITLIYPNGEMGRIHVSWLEPKKVREIVSVGSKRMAVWDDLIEHAPLAVYETGSVIEMDYSDFREFQELSKWTADIVRPDVPPTEPLKLQSEAFLSAVSTGRVDRSDGSFGVGVIKTLQAVQRSLREGGAPVSLEKRS